MQPEKVCSREIIFRLHLYYFFKTQPENRFFSEIKMLIVGRAGSPTFPLNLKRFVRQACPTYTILQKIISRIVDKPHSESALQTHNPVRPKTLQMRRYRLAARQFQPTRARNLRRGCDSGTA